jgi:hypothetical protein
MMRYALIAALLMVIGLGGALAWTQANNRALIARADRLHEQLRTQRGRADAAEAAASAAREAHRIAVLAMQEAERERAAIASAIANWRTDHGETLDARAPDALLDLIGRLQPARGGEGGSAPSD